MALFGDGSRGPAHAHRTAKIGNTRNARLMAVGNVALAVAFAAPMALTREFTRIPGENASASAGQDRWY